MQGQDHGKRRGRRPVRPDPDEGAIAAFADRLLRLKEEAGNPSYAEMSAELGAAASKSSLASAAQGRRLPSWETTWEFVRVLAVDRLGRDPGRAEREWREHWDHAKAATTESPSVAPAEGTASPSPRPARRIGLLIGLTAAVAVIVPSFLYLTADPPPAEPKPSPPPSASGHDDSQFVGDITYPDGTPVRPGTTFTKVWRLRNTGTTTWHDRRLTRVNTSACQAPDWVPIPPTTPGRTVDIKATVQAAPTPATCRIY
ncbi:NBR1-Ig-like domain-containing protein [Spongiactinospora sp. TRM90649]|uniref:NBR1-Ig-like domain-containing protein n=1 Tax=Spongiactinospora sp. TRM90649 TaxID=3031114 RepID=UPI0023F749CE|nr:NBR1-Ig-like domain-containing protein [Spongiactinospora sp. TRM90649]MDF5754984.1 NBR1-Ig-like domain-containing protein [Spongiactinospora sp. TRM90649]